MRTIKFRGMRPNGIFVSGDLIHRRAFTQIAVTHVLKFNVYPDTVKQLCGLDANGKEVYEGDILLDELENEHAAEIYDRPNFLASLTLKE